MEQSPQQCAICGGPVPDGERVCDGCFDELARHREGMRPLRIEALAQQLMLGFAVVLFARGWWMALDASSYGEFIGALGLPQRPPAAHYVAAGMSTISAVLYALAWVAGHLGLGWRLRAAVAAFGVYLLGQTIAEVASLGPNEPAAKAFALVATAVAIPFVQLVLLLIARAAHRSPPAS